MFKNNVWGICTSDFDHIVHEFIVYPVSFRMCVINELGDTFYYNNKFDENLNLLGVANGVLETEENKILFRYKQECSIIHI